MGPNHTGKREDVDPRRTALLQSVRERFHRGAGGIDIVDQQDRLSHDFGASAQGERAPGLITPGNGNRIEVRWFKCMQGAELDGVIIVLVILVYLDVMNGLNSGIVADRKERLTGCLCKGRQVTVKLRCC